MHVSGHTRVLLTDAMELVIVVTSAAMTLTYVKSVMSEEKELSAYVLRTTTLVSYASSIARA